MMAAHLAAAALVALWLAHGERNLYSVVTLTGSLVLSLLPVRCCLWRPPSCRGRPTPAKDVADRLRVLLLTRPVSRRGPPLLAA